MMPTVIVQGPMACGKTRNRVALARHFGCLIVVEDWNPATHRLTRNALHLTNADASNVDDADIYEFGSFDFDREARATILVEKAMPK